MNKQARPEDILKLGTVERYAPIDDTTVTRLVPKSEADPYVRDHNGNIKPIYANVIAMLRSEGREFDLRFDEFSRRHFCRGRLLSDGDIREIAEWIQRKGVTAAVSVISEGITRTAEGAPFHQVTDYLNALTWDQQPRLETFMIDHAGVTDTALNRAQIRKFMIQSAARIYKPGCQADATLVLEGEQNLGKSSLLRALFGEDWFTDHLPDMASKDAMLQLRGVWCIEIAELATLARTDAARIKQFLTSRSDRYREPYGRVTSDTPRSCVFAGTVNPGAGGYLKDETGGRRFWPIEVTHNVNVEAITRLRDQLWAEAVARFKAGETWHLDTDALVAAATEIQAGRYVGDPWQEAIEIFVSTRDEVTLTEILRDALDLLSVGKLSQADQNRVSRCLSHMKWERFQKRLPGGARTWVYRRGRNCHQ